MGKSLAQKQDVVADLKEQLDGTQMIMAIDFTGLSVAEITKLRRQLRPTGAVYAR